MKLVDFLFYLLYNNGIKKSNVKRCNCYECSIWYVFYGWYIKYVKEENKNDKTTGN